MFTVSGSSKPLTVASRWIIIVWVVMVHVLLCGLLYACGEVPETLPYCWAHWPIQSNTLSWALELAVMPELTPSVLGKWRVWVISSNDPKREAASLSQSVGFHILWNVRVCTSLRLILCLIHYGCFCYLCKSLIVKILASLSSGLSKELHVLLSCGHRECNLARPSWSCLYLRNFTCPPCPSIPGASCQNCRHWRQKCGIPLFILTLYIQLMCFIAYHLLVPVKALQLLEQIELPFSFFFTPYLAVLWRQQLIFWLAIKSLLWYKKLLYSCVILEGTCWPFCHSSLMCLI